MKLHKFKTFNLADLILFVFLVLFPFGQLIKINLKFGGIDFPIHPLELIVFLSVLTWPVFDKTFRALFWFIFIAAFSYIFSLGVNGPQTASTGGLYLLRLVAFFFFTGMIYRHVGQKTKLKALILNSIFLVTLVTAVFGWIQYFWFSDLRVFVVFGWDDHLNRLAGSFMDPGFTSIVLVAGALISLLLFLKSQKKRFLLSLLFLGLTIGFTYSRAGYLALLVGVVTSLLIYKRYKLLKIFCLLFLVTVLLLPKRPGEGTNLLRTQSVIARLESTRGIGQIIADHPIFGVGYNNLCAVRKNYPEAQKFGEHSCSGVDNSLIFVWVTTGITGLVLFISFLINAVRSASHDIYGQAFTVVGLAFLVHSLFTNTLFYPWVMGIALLLWVISRSVGDRQA